MSGGNGRPDHDFPLMPPGVREIQQEMAHRQWHSVAEANAFIQRRMAEYNAAPQDELGGLSPLQAHELLSGDWATVGPLRLDETLALDDLRECHLLVAARALLGAAAEPRGIKATTAGNLNRRTVAALLDVTPWPAGYVPEARHWNKVINEEDFQPVHVLRLLLTLAKLLRRRGGAFQATKRGRDLLADGRAGSLAAILLRTLYLDFNLGYLGGWEETEPRQPLVPLFLLRLTVLDREWRLGRGIVPLVDPAADMEAEIARLAARYPGLYEAESRETSSAELPSFAFSSFVHRILEPLEWLGLLEGREVPGAYPTIPDREMRKTPLFDVFVTFPGPFRDAALRRSVKERRP